MTLPTRRSAAIFATKAAALRLIRRATDFRSGPKKHPAGSPTLYPFVLAESFTPLWPHIQLEESEHQRGKVQNLRRAASSLNGIAIPADEVFSFWKQIGRTTKRRGYATGRMLQQGCLIPSIGGGLCQISNALYDICLIAGFEIIERHAHSQIVPGSVPELGRDATVAWNYVDLRFRPNAPALIEAFLTEDDLVLRFRGVTEPSSIHPRTPASLGITPTRVARSCSTCGEEKCFRHPH